MGHDYPPRCGTRGSTRGSTSCTGSGEPEGSALDVDRARASTACPGSKPRKRSTTSAAHSPAPSSTGPSAEISSTSTRTTGTSGRRSTWRATDSAQGSTGTSHRPLPEIVTELRAAFWPHLLPIARDWAARLRRPAPWPDRLDDWLEQCHAAGQTRSTPLMLRYGPGDWNALHRDLYGDLVFPLQVVIGLDAPDVDYTGARVRRRRAAAACAVRARPRPSSVAATRSCSRPVTGRCDRRGAGRRRRCGTA